MRGGKWLWGVVGLWVVMVVGLWWRGRGVFDYVAVDVPGVGTRHERLSAGSGCGWLWFAYGWPSAGWDEIVFYAAAPGWWTAAEVGEAVPRGERVDLARAQFEVLLDGVTPAVNYPVWRVPVWVLLVVPAGVGVWGMTKRPKAQVAQE